MIRKEAIEMLKALNMMLRNSDGEPISDVCDALDMAIEALKTDIVLCGECSYMMPDGRCCVFADDAIRPSVSDFCSYGERISNEITTV